ncbi:hypothetical protein [Geodermatophilus sp. SYSU D00815]
MTWLLALLAWTVCAVVVAPLVGRVLGHAGTARPRRRMPAAVPRPRAPLPRV